MARTKAQNYDEKRDILTRKAADLFAEKGFSGASISDISKACGVSKSLIYHYYDAKEDILYGVMNAHVEELVETVNNPNRAKPNARDEFLDLTRALLSCYAGAENAQKVLLYEINNLPQQQQNDIKNKQRQIITRFETVYIRLFPALKNQSGLLRSKIMLFFGMVNWVHTWYDPKGDINPDSLAKLITETILSGAT